MTASRWTGKVFRAAPRELPPAPPPHPAPDVACRTAADTEMPRTALALAAAATKAGWTVRRTYARGTLLQGRGEPRVVDSVAVRLRRPGSPALVGCWTDGKFMCGYSYARGLTPRRLSARELTAEVTA